MKRIITTALIFGLAPLLSHASIPQESVRNGLIQSGNSLLTLIDEKEKNSALSRCLNEDRGTRLFSNSCNELVSALKKRMNMMVLESDLQIQNERLNGAVVADKDNQKIAWLAKINLLATQAEETIKAVQTNPKNSDTKNDVPDVMAAVSKVKISYLSYLKFFEK